MSRITTFCDDEEKKRKRAAAPTQFCESVSADSVQRGSLNKFRGGPCSCSSLHPRHTPRAQIARRWTEKALFRIAQDV